MFFAKLKDSIFNNVFYLLEVICFVFGISGVAAAILFGKLLLALVFACLVVAIFFRLAGRRKGHTVARANSPAWKRPITVLLSLISTVLLVEAINLPVRFDQPHFNFLHWGLATAFIFIFYWLFTKTLWTNSNK